MKHLSADTDRPLTDTQFDRFGFAGIAKRLAPSVVSATEGDGMVIGVEGPWGSGKTTLLNFLEEELNDTKPDNIHVIKIAPWLDGDASSLVNSLMEPIAEILDGLDAKNEKSSGWERGKHKRSEIWSLVTSYGAKTGRVLTPAARLAEYALPGAKVVADVLEVGADYLEKLGRRPTTAEIKSRIADRLKRFQVGFVVILDDLDRLEPSLAVEVVRLVRSVADFPGVAYLLCYDRSILSHALQVGLDVPDGDAFLQKIVQLTFSIPMPEPFDLRQNFLEEAIDIFESANGTIPENDLLLELREAVDREGSGLRTPREVKLALNGVRFAYPSLKDDIYYPDLCRLHLIKIIRPALYRWLEEYLSERSILVTGDGSIPADERNSLGHRLEGLLPEKDAGSVNSIWSLRRFVPGVIDAKEPKDRVFSTATDVETRSAIDLRRLGSPIHYRFYFALTSPKTVMPDKQFSEILKAAENDADALTATLIGLAQTTRRSGRSWFEHVVDRLDSSTVRRLDLKMCCGFVHAIAQAMDTVIAADSRPRPMSLSVDDKAEETVEVCLRRVKALDPDIFQSLSIWLAKDCPSMGWLLGRFFRTQMWHHGIVGDRPHSSDTWLFSEQELSYLLAILKRRAATTAQKAAIKDLPKLSSYLWGWKELSGEAVVGRWVKSYVKDDKNFLAYLEALKGWALSDRVYYPLNPSAISDYLDFDQTLTRLRALARVAEYEARANDLLEAIRIGRH